MGAGQDFQGKLPLNIMVDQNTAGHLVGSGGSVVREIQSASKAIVNIDKDRTRALKAVGLLGESSCKRVALQMILEKLTEAQLLGGKLTIMVPPEGIPLVVGARGANVIKIQKESGTNVDVARRGVGGMAGTISITGDVPNIIEAAMEIDRLVNSTPLRNQGAGFTPSVPPHSFVVHDAPMMQMPRGNGAMALPVAAGIGGPRGGNGGGIPIDLYLETDMARSMVGKGGQTIRDIQDQTGGRVEISRDPGPNQLVRIHGAGKFEALRTILMRVGQYSPTPTISINFVVDKEFTGLLVGTGGQTVRSIQSQSGAGISIPKPGNPMQEAGVITVEGGAEQVATAGIMMNDVINKDRRAGGLDPAMGMSVPQNGMPLKRAPVPAGGMAKMTRMEFNQEE